MPFFADENQQCDLVIYVGGLILYVRVSLEPCYRLALYVPNHSIGFVRTNLSLLFSR